ncbi:helix-turn-helix domain-containing protein [Halobacteriovorax sp. ZH4_bin.1]|uniref:helix-turn-helix domain-containing protein n=1 Tax=unclassified Halobacteriovorax TaxID=2639665 RepID=UPI00371C2B99
MQNTTNITIHILECNHSLKSTTQNFKDYFDILKYINNKVNFIITSQFKTKLSARKTVNYLVIPPSHNPQKATAVETKIINAHLASKDSKVIACCGGTFKLASTGALNNKKVTTHWFFEKKLKAEYPKVNIEAHRTIVESGKVITAGGVLSYLDVICLIIKKELGTKIARMYNEIIQGPGIREYQIPRYKEDSDSELKQLFAIYDELKNEDLTLTNIAQNLGMSPRGLQRHLKERFNTTFRDSLKAYRLKKVQEYLLKDIPIKEISYKLGFIDDMSFRRFFKKEMKMPISQYRSLLLLNI